MSCKVMGIVNVTPDSFSDGGQFFRPEEAIRRAKNLVADGADIIDLGGESTRPGAMPIGWEEEWARIEPVLVGLTSSVSRLKSSLPIRHGITSPTSVPSISFSISGIGSLYTQLMISALALIARSAVSG